MTLSAGWPNLRCTCRARRLGGEVNSRRPNCHRESRHLSATRRPKTQSRKRGGVAAVEFAVLLPLLVLTFVLAVDFGRVFYTSLTLQNCAWAGALYASDPHVADESPFANVTEAALADAANLSSPPVITQTSGADASGRSYVEVTAAYPFQMMTSALVSSKQINVSRTVRMYIAAIKPDGF
jgi:Flp pilus assembly protein TadG